MNNRRLGFLFLTNLILLIAGSGLMPLLPLRAIDLGATASGAGAVMAAAYLAVLLGTLVAGRVTALKAHRSRMLFLIAVSGNVGGFLLAGKAGTLSLYAGGILLAWFSGGFQVVMVSIFTGLNAGEKKRGRAFALIQTASPVGAVIGGLASGRLVDVYGYQTLFQVAATIQLLLIPLSLLALQEAPAQEPDAPASAEPRQPEQSLPAAFWLLLGATLFTAIAVVLGRLGTTLLMEEAGFSTTAITTVVAVGGLVTIPLLPLAGALSDRNQSGQGAGRSRFLALSFLLALLGLLLLSRAGTLWQYQVVALSLSLAAALAGSLAAARASELAPRPALARALSLMNSTNWVAMILGFAAGGYLLERFAPAVLYLGAALLPLAGLLLLAIGQKAGDRRAPLPVGQVEKGERTGRYVAGG